jgi:hypothetical protein
MYWDKTLATLVCAVCALAARAETPKLTVEDVDQLSQAKIVQDLTGGAPKPAAAAAPQTPTAPVAAVPASAPAPVQKPVRYVAPVTPVTFVGAYRDDHGGSFVLYDYSDSVYSARVGEKLLNGWTARKVNGFLVTVEEGAGRHPRTWTEPIRAVTPPVAVAAPAAYAGNSLQALRDLGSPLPPGMVSGPHPAIIQGGAQ